MYLFISPCFGWTIFSYLWIYRLMLTVCTVPTYIIGNERLHAVFAVSPSMFVCVLNPMRCRNSRLMSIQFQWKIWMEIDGFD